MKKIRVHFVDGTYIDRDAETTDAGKRAAKAERAREVGQADRSDARVKVARVEELGEK